MSSDTSTYAPDCLRCGLSSNIFAAAFLNRDEKLPHVRQATRKVDTLKLLSLILWETKSLDIKKYIVLSEALDEIGKMLGGWNGQLTKNSTLPKQGEK